MAPWGRGDKIIGYVGHRPVYEDGRGPYVIFDGGDHERKIDAIACSLCGEFSIDGDDVKLDEHSICHTCADAIMNLKHHKHSGQYVTWPNEESPRDRERRLRRPIKPGLRRQVHERDYYACRYCGARQALVVDHVLPVSRGGENELDNLVTACTSCNATKFDRTPEEAGLTLHPPETFAPREGG